MTTKSGARSDSTIPASCSAVKLKKRAMEAQLTLVPNPDILAELAPKKAGRLFIGFAAETHDLLAEAQGKLARKGLDLIVANDVTQPGAGFERQQPRVSRRVCRAERAGDDVARRP